MPPISADLSILHQCLQLSFNHPSSRLFRNDQLVGSMSGPLPKVDQSLAFSGIQTLLQAQRTLKEGVGYLHSLLDHLASLENDTEVLLARCRALVAPVRCLPVELLQYIFEFVRLQDDRMEVERGKPYAIAQVCHLWRNVALSTPSLWTTIAVRLSPGNVGMQLEHVSRRMERTGGHPIALIINDIFFRRQEDVPLDGSTPEDRSLMAGVNFARGLDSYGSRLKSLRCGHHSRETTLGLLSTLNASKTYCMPNLKSFSIDGFPGESDDWESIKDFLYQKAPKLECFSADGDDLGGIFDLQSTNIKHFRANVSWDVLPNLQQVLPQSIEVLELGRFGSWEGFVAPVFQNGLHASTFLQNLTSLSIVPTAIPRVSPTDLVPLPSLRHLILTQQCFPTGSPVYVRSILEAWGSQLDYLSLVTHDIDKYEEDDDVIRVAAYLELTPQLQALRLGSGNYVEAVQYADLPRLSHCEFNFDVLSKGGLASLQTFAMHLKKEPHPSLRTIDILHTITSGIQDIHSSMSTLIKDFAESGILVNLRKRTSWEDDKFDGPYFERLGGIFDTLYSSD